ncbi:uncharacterized protein B0P05DRAFT_584424 [Gilbertella persicaria]|uniref:uncharacterized protein n=1 Tax=Gilbertella persicaria TaxID=101096 RepID=UPI00221FBDB1|nr:uncharacterized protein B0P05DRAFT_584424 [Gilbertella persicaria]KAI8090208.1 hypothetical protein B0P05DRAFT_584424 [Gilbertella persicaria]
MTQHQADFLNHHDNVHGWLLDVPGYRENCRHEKEKKMASSEDSISLDELINANFTTNMADETDLPALASLELDDSKEEFWRVDNTLNHYIPAQFSGKKEPSYYGSNRSRYGNEMPLYKANEEFGLSNSALYEKSFGINVKPSRMQSPPKSPLSIANHSKRLNRSGSVSSENSSNSQSISSHRHQVHPTASTSTSSASTTSSSALSRSLTTSASEHKSSSLHRKPSMTSILSESTQESRLPSRSVSHLARRATHIPAPNSIASPPSLIKMASSNAPVPQRTKSTMIVDKSNNNSLNRVSQLNRRASHIPAPTTRSITSLGMSSIFSAHQTKHLDRPQTSLGSLKPSASTVRLSRTTSLIGAPTPSKSTIPTTGLKRFGRK